MSGTRGEQLCAALLAALCAVLFLGPALLPGRALVPYPPELHAVEGAAARAAGIAPDELYRGNLSMGDKYGQSLAWDRILQDRLRAGELPLWTKDIAGGASFVPQMAQVYQPWNLLLLWIDSTEIYGFWYLLHQILFGWLGYRFFRRIGASHGAGLLGVVACVLGLWVQCRVHHNVVLTAALSLWPMLSAIHAIFRGAGSRAVAGLGLWTGLTWMTGFVVVSLQISYLAVGFALLQMVGQERGQRLRPLLLCGFGIALGGLLSAAHMLPVLFASAASARTPMTLAKIQQLALEWDHALTLLWPDLFCWAADWFHRDQPDLVRPPWTPLVFFGRPDAVNGYNWVETSFAFGTAPLLAALLAFAEPSRRALALFFGGVALFALAVATATPGVVDVAAWLPGFSAADAKRNVFLVTFAGIVLAVLGADRLLQQRPRMVLVAIGLLLALSATATAFCWVAGETELIDWVARGIALDREHPQVAAVGGDIEQIRAWIRGAMWPGEAHANLVMLRTTFGRATLVLTVIAAAMCLRGRQRLLLLLLVTIAELWHVGRGPVVAVAAERVRTPPPIMQPLLQAPLPAPGVRPRLQRLGDPGDRRANVLYFPNEPGYHRIEDLAAYNPLPPRRMEQFFLAIEPDEPNKVSVTWNGAGISWFRRDRSLQHRLLDVLGVRYVLSSRAIEQPGCVDVTPAGTPAPHRLYERTTCLPRATFVTQARIVADEAERLRELGRMDRDPGAEMILEDPAAPVLAAVAPTAAQAAVAIVDHDDECVRITVRNEAAGYLRLADPFDPGWIATVEGQPATIYVADHYLRAVYLPPGQHEVVFTFAAPRVLWPPRLSLLALATIVALWGIGRRRAGAALR